MARDTTRYREAAVRRNADPAYRRRLSEACKRRSARPDYRAKMREAATCPHPWVVERNKLVRLTGPRPRQSEAMRRKYAGPDGPRLREINSRTATDVNRRWFKHEFLDARGRLWKLKSRLEVAFAVWLDQQGLAWWYERETFLLSDGRRYTPDFYVQQWGTYVEVKGSPRGLDKVNLALADGKAVLLLRGWQSIKALVGWVEV